MTTVWRVHLATAGQDPRRFCVNRGIVGVGWAIEHAGPVDWATYEALAAATYDRDGPSWRSAVNALRAKMEIDDLCWSRDELGIYYLGRITGPWRYENDDEHRAADVVNVRPCKWVTVGAADKVPGTVLRNFIRGQTVRRIPDPTTIAASKLLYNRAAGEALYRLEPVAADLFQLLSPWDLENLLGLYLQARLGYMLVPRTNHLATPHYEFVMVHRDGRRAAIQVKSGSVVLDRGDYLSIAQQFDQFFLFTTTGAYVGTAEQRLTCLLPEDVRAFADESYAFMPGSLQLFMDLARALQGVSNREDR